MKLETCILVGVALLTSACAAGERPLQPRPTPVRSERDAYAANARVNPGTLRAWEDASRRALRSSRPVPSSFSDRIVFRSDEPDAVAYRLSLARGQSVRVTTRPARGGGTIFTDMFHEIGGDMFRPVHWAGRGSETRTFTARTDGEYVLRVQPPIGRGGTYEVAVASDASLVFPVQGVSRSAIGSVFGDPRDGGAREHEGVDIFAPRGTPVLAVADGWIEQSRNTPVGGLVIWQRDANSSLRYYYAHLDELHAREGTYVRAGDIIGRVGNTGNARGVRPHLHFAIYRPGTIPLDPAPLLTQAVEQEE